jgi:hypothetical protein
MDIPPSRWWPLVGLSAMVLLGLLVGPRSTAVDDWFTAAGAMHPALRGLLFFTNPVVLGVLSCAALVMALWRRRWRLAVAVVVAPAVGIVASRGLKRLFWRVKGESPIPALAYPSGHVTATVLVLGMVVLAVGVHAWAVVTAAVWTVPAMLGQGVTYHYFTDTVGAVFLATSLVCLAAWAAGVDRRQSQCDLRHIGR